MPRPPADERPSRVFRKSRRFEEEAKRLGANVRALRLDRHWTLERAAEQTHLDMKHFQKIEVGSLNLTLVTLVRLAQGFETDIPTLFRVETGRTTAAAAKGGRRKTSHPS